MKVEERAMRGLHLVKRAVREDCGLQAVREGSSGRVVMLRPAGPERVPGPVLPRVWAVAEAGVAEQPEPKRQEAAPRFEVAFYRKYTEAMLRRYLKLSMESGRVPSLLGRELFRGHVTSYKVRSFEDVVIFCHDVERCLQGLSVREKELVKRVALQEYSQAEAAAALGISVRTCVLQYRRTLDQLTNEFLRVGMLDPQKCCQ